MWKWIGRALLTVLLIGGVFVAYDYYRAGLHTRPEMPEGAFSISYKNGMRAILVGVPDEKETRRYFGYPYEVPFYIEDAWSFCHPPVEGNEEFVASFLSKQNNPGERFEALCTVKVDDETVARGVITSVPKL